jgi:hypothetical protein
MNKVVSSIKVVREYALVSTVGAMFRVSVNDYGAAIVQIWNEKLDDWALANRSKIGNLYSEVLISGLETLGVG